MTKRSADANFKHILGVLLNVKYAAISFIGFLIFSTLILYFTKLDLMLGNLGVAHTMAYSVLNFIVAALFGVYIALLVHSINETNSLQLRNSASGFLGAGTSALVTGCVACGVTLASYLGLASILSVLPFYGLELNVAGVLLLSYSIKKLSDDKPKTCKV